MLTKGTRVRLTSPRYTWVKLQPGHVGTVLRDHDHGDIVHVQFDDWTHGHTAEGLLSIDAAWYVSFEDLEVLTTEGINAHHQTDQAPLTQAGTGSVQSGVSIPQAATGSRRVDPKRQTGRI